MTINVGPAPEEHVYRAGLAALRSAVGKEDLLEFPKRSNGTAVLSRQGFFQRLLNNELDLVSCPSVDIIAAQADVRYLVLSQLLHIYCNSFEIDQSAPAMRAQSEFLMIVMDCLEKRLGEMLAAEGGVAIPSGQTSEVARLVALIYGVHGQLDKEADDCGRWLVRTGQFEAILVLDECELHELASPETTSTYCHRSLTKPGSEVSRAKRRLHWEVELSSDPKAFDSAPRPRPSRSSLGRRSTVGLSSIDDKSQDFVVPAAELENLRRRLSDAEGALGPMRMELAAAKVRVDEINAHCDQLSAAKDEAEHAKDEAEHATEVAVRESQALQAELGSLREKLASAILAETAAREELITVNAKLASAKEVELRVTMKANGFRQELALSKQAEQELSNENAALREQLAALRKANQEFTTEAVPAPEGEVGSN